MDKLTLKKLKSGTDIRGVAVGDLSPVTLTDEAITLVTKAFCKWIYLKNGNKKIKIAVGHDSRITAAHIKDLVIAAINGSGFDAVYTGLCSTPSSFILLKKSDLGCGASVMITASHMPYDRNGLKFFTPDGGLNSQEIDEILEIAASGDFFCGSGKVSEKSFMDGYSRILVETVEKACGKQPLKGKKIIVDAGNGAGGFFAEKVLLPLGADITGSQFLNPDGHFPNHIPNPEDKAAIKSLSDAVVKNKADLGIIFDTDVDRAGCVDGTGKEINRDTLIALISAILLKDRAGVIVTDSVTCDALTEFIESLGGKHLRFKRGYKNVIDKCIELNDSGIYSPLGMETSGHACFKENYYLDDGAYLIVKVLISLALMAKEGKSPLSLISGFKAPAEEDEVRLTFNAKSVDFKSEGESVISYLKNIESIMSGVKPDGENYEGVKLRFDSGRVIVRMSVHDPVMPINFESDNKGGNVTTAKKLLGVLKNFEFLNVAPLENLIKSK